jgi:hypothetical protein
MTLLWPFPNRTIAAALMQHPLPLLHMKNRENIRMKMGSMMRAMMKKQMTDIANQLYKWGKSTSHLIIQKVMPMQAKSRMNLSQNMQYFEVLY